MGVLTYVLLCGYPPFNGQSDKDILLKVKGGRFGFPDAEWAAISAEAKDFVKGLLEFNPANRLSARAALDHAWMKHSLPADAPIDMKVQGRILASLRSFRGVSKLKKLALTAIAHQLIDSEIAELKASFSALDANGDGTLTVSEIKSALDKAAIVLPPDFEDLVSAIDSDGSGSIDYMEFIAATLDQKLYVQRDVCWRAFRMFDRNGDGKISVAELSEILKDDLVTKNFDTAGICAMVKEFDLNNDGEIDFDEFMAMMQQQNC